MDETTHFTLEFPNNVKASAVASVGLADVYYFASRLRKSWYELEPLCDCFPVHGRTSAGLILNKIVSIEQTTKMDNEALAIMNGGSPIVPGEIAMQEIHTSEVIFKAASIGSRIKV